MDFKLTCSLQKTDTMILAIHNDPKFFNVCQIPDLFLSCASPEHHHEWGEAILTSPMMASLYLWHKCWSLLPGPSRRSLSQLFSTTEMISSSSIQIQSCLAIIFIYPSLPQSWFSEKWVPSNVSNIAIFHWTMSVGETVHANPPPPTNWPCNFQWFPQLPWLPQQTPLGHHQWESHPSHVVPFDR